MALPCTSVMVTMVLLNDAFTCATPALMFLRSRRRTRVVSALAILSSGRSHRRPQRQTRVSSTESSESLRAPEPLLLLAGNRLGRTLPGTSIGVRALAAHRQAPAMPQATIIPQVH